MNTEDETTAATGDADVVRAVFEQMPLMMAGLEGPEHRVVAANGAFRAGADRAAPVGAAMHAVFPESVGQRVHEVYDRVLATGRTESSHEWCVRTKAGGRVVEGFYDCTAAPRVGVDGAVKGVCVFVTDVTDRVHERQAARERTEEAEHRCAQARETIAELRRASLPEYVPVLPSVRVAARHAPAEGGGRAGGGWFDVADLPGGLVALVMGDAVGPGAASSAVVGQLRTVVLERLHSGESPAAALSAADRFTAWVPGGRATTCCVVVLVPADGRLVYASAGRPAPLLVAPDGATRYLARGAGPLGTGASYRDQDDRVPDGGVVLLYTDGLVERPGVTPAEGRAVLAATAAAAVLDRAPRHGGPPDAVERMLARTLEFLLRDGGHGNDVTLLAAHRTPPVPAFETVLPAVVDSVRAIQFELGLWLLHVGCCDEDETAVQHAVVELVTNVVDHAYPDAEAPDADRSVRVSARLTENGTALIEVADHGHWSDRGQPDPVRGRGLAMVELFTGAFTVDRGAVSTGRGTTVRISHRLRRPVVVTTGTASAATRSRDLRIEEVLDAVGHLTVSGIVDTTTAPRLKAGLMSASHGGTTDLTVDLSAVTRLAGAGVQVLHDTVALCAGNGRTGLTLVARADSVAASVLDLADLPYTQGTAP
ncbi:SpoIIE family protein phosphatase [Streptomyces triticiradicis]|uniref:SpoIIE family protein phosphatase n=1 Tax=Streptomyces triticiradicis TaxID=2651189 RepID=A0A7J5DHY4_9ACTN|nr:SpoIIE family protein phosphatase [Streptomyces triticiradicis]KAB1988257.1 SpoIIE family protein phosphatase [Streptomyces triticiradicis]